MFPVNGTIILSKDAEERRVNDEKNNNRFNYYKYNSNYFRNFDVLSRNVFSLDGIFFRTFRFYNNIDYEFKKGIIVFYKRLLM